MTDEQQMQLVGEVVDQLRAGELTAKQALVALWSVMSPSGRSYEDVAMEVRCGVAHLLD